MEKPNTLAVSFKARAEKGKDGVAPVYLKLTVNKVAREVSLKYSVELKLWNSRKGRPKLITEEMRQLNTELETEAGLVLKAYKEIEREGDVLNADAVKKRYIGINQPEAAYTLKILMTEYEKDQKPDMEWGSWKNYIATYCYLNRYIAERYPANDVRVSKIDHAFMAGFKTYIRENPITPHRPAGQNGLAKHIERVKRMVNWAQESGKLAVNRVEKYRAPKKKFLRKYITEFELGDLETCKLNDRVQQMVRDFFIFAVYTGVSYGDLMALKPIDLVVGMDGQRWISNQRLKSENYFLVPLLHQPLAIIKKYWEDERSIDRDALFPYISNSKINTELKIISTARCYSRPLQFHDVRHMFATYITLAKNVPIESVSKMMGHAKISTTQVYAKIVAAKVKEDMAILQARLDRNQPAAVKLLEVSMEEIIAATRLNLTQGSNSMIGSLQKR
ncbi:integrase/recombinase XerD [Chitinophaga sp. W2I13]|uniref:tyrosine-type recombinase/integrase n=1 Tax=Chitinophaga sp. W2I13 TaxID=3373923 RepID=UPI003D21C11E